MNVAIEQAAIAIQKARCLVITAGAGMGADSGLPDFRGPEGLWKAYPPLKERGLTLPETSTPSWFTSDPNFAWGFFGHRLKLYKKTQPHYGFEILRKWSSKMEIGHFIYTSNVDGHFQKAGFSEENIVECHGSINFLQTVRGYQDIWPVPKDLDINIDNASLTAFDPLPVGPPDIPVEDQVLARPNILMFGDYFWVSDRTMAQEERLHSWLHYVRGNPIVVLEIGSGLYVPTVRYQSERIVRCSAHRDSCLIRINPKDFSVDGKNDISIPMKGLEALTEIDGLI